MRFQASAHHDQRRALADQRHATCFSSRFSGGMRERPLPAPGQLGVKRRHGEALFPLCDDECRQDDNAAAGVVQLPRARHGDDAVRRRPLPQRRYRTDLVAIGLEAEAEMFRDGDDLFARVAEHHDHTTMHCVFVESLSQNRCALLGDMH